MRIATSCRYHLLRFQPIYLIDQGIVGCIGDLVFIDQHNDHVFKTAAVADKAAHHSPSPCPATPPMLPYLHMHPRITRALNSFLKALFLFTGTVLALFSTYMIWWRTNFCLKMVQWNAAIPSHNFDNYLIRRFTQREVCDPSEYTSGYGALFVGIIIAVVAWHTLTWPKAVGTQPPTEPPMSYDQRPEAYHVEAKGRD